MKIIEQAMTGIASGVVVLVCAVSYQAWGDGNNATESQPRQIAYQGTLHFNTEPEPEEVKMRFSLYNSPTVGAPDACTEPALVAGCVWQEQRDTVPLYGGKFFVNLGEFNAVDAVVYDAEALYLGIEVQRDGTDPDWVPLANRQRINPAPFALWATQASNFNVAGNLDVAGATNLGNLDVAGATNLGNLNVTGGLTTLNRNSDNVGQLGQGVLNISERNGAANMIIDGDEIDSTNILHLNLNSDGLVMTGGALEVTGATDLNGNLDVSGVITDSDSDVTIADGLVVTGNITDSNSDVTIADGLVVTGSVSIAGSLNIGLQTVVCGTIDNTNDTLVCDCPAGTALVSGGASCTSQVLESHLRMSYAEATPGPGTQYRWRAQCVTGGTASAGADQITVMCARIVD